MKPVLIFLGIMFSLIVAKGFDSMSFGEAVGYVQGAAALLWGMWLSLPLGAFIAIRRRRKSRPGAPVFAHLVLWGWLGLMGLLILYFFSGAWYGENGPAPEVAAKQMAGTLIIAAAFTVATHVGLYVTTRAHAQN